MTLLMSVCRLAMIAGFATATMVLSTRIMKNPRHSAHSAGHGLVPAPTLSASIVDHPHSYRIDPARPSILPDRCGVWNIRPGQTVPDGQGHGPGLQAVPLSEGDLATGRVPYR